MDESFLKEQAARCRSLADKADEFTKRRLLDLASRYENRLRGQASRASRLIKLPSVTAEMKEAAKRPYLLSSFVMSASRSSWSARIVQL
jgi:hypothetical protein